MKARDYALFQLDAKHLPRWPNDVFKRHLVPADRPTDARDQNLAEHIYIGVTKNLLYLQYLMRHFSGRPLESIEPKIQKILAVGLYQLRFLTRVPQSASVHQAVEQAKRFGKPQAAGFVNAVLRRAAREATEPIPDPKLEPANYAELILSHPPDLFARLMQLMGPESAIALCRKHNSEPPTILRLFRGVNIDQLKIDDVQLFAHEQSGMVVAQGARQAILANWAEHGLAQVQDPTSAGVVDSCDLQPGQLVLDRCCGVGTKTLQLAERIGPTGRVVGIDPSKQRLALLEKSIRDHLLSNISLCHAPMMRDVPADAPVMFDRVLIDVPCSNSGVLSRRAEARFHQDPPTLASLQKLQWEILADTAPRVTDQGLLVYSTCSIWPEENENQVNQFLSHFPQFSLVSQKTTLPSIDDVITRHHDGGFVAVLRRAR